MTSGLVPVRFDSPIVNPSSPGLFGVTSWQVAGDGAPLRWLPAGVEIRAFNYGGEDSFGVWGADWCISAEDLAEGDRMVAGERPDPLPPFAAITVWASDECDLTLPSQAEVRVRAQQNFRLQEPTAVEREFAARLLADAGTLDTAVDIVGAVARLEEEFARTNTVGLIHASPVWAASAAQTNLLRYGGGGQMTTPLGHKWVFGGGYADGLGDRLIATSPTMGWRGPVSIHEAENERRNVFFVVAERSQVVGYEALVGAVEVTG